MMKVVKGMQSRAMFPKKKMFPKRLSTRKTPKRFRRNVGAWTALVPPSASSIDQKCVQHIADCLRIFPKRVVPQSVENLDLGAGQALA